MANSINGAGASAGFVVSNSGAAPTYARARRHALLGSSALIGIALSASPAFAQTAVGGGTITANGATITDNTGGGGGVRVTNVDQGNGVTVQNVTINQTVDGPAAAALSVEGDSGSTGATFTGTNSLTTTVSGNAAYRQTSNGNNGLSFLSSGNTFTGSFGIIMDAPNGFSAFNSQGQSQTIIANGTAVTGISVAAQLNPEVYLGTSTISGFATGVNVTTTDPRQLFALVNSTGGSINATQVGINIAPAAASIGVVESQSAITAPIGIQVSGGNGATITTSGGGTINSTASGTGTGIIATSSSGANNVTVTVGAAIGGTTAPLRGVDARTTGTSTGTVSVTNNAAITATGNAIYSASNATSGNVINVNADVSGGGLAVVQAVGQGYTVNVGAAATVSAAGATALLFETGDGVVVNAGTLQKSGNGNGVIQFNQGGTVTNTGTIFTANGTASGITGDAGLTVINSGSISAGNRGINTSGNHSFATSITNQSGGSITGAIGIFLGNGGTGTNTLDLQQGSTTGLIFSAAGGTTTTTLAGTLTGDYTVIGGAGANNFTLASTGLMQGATFGSAADTFTFNGGTINGVVNAGSGTDTFNSVLGAGNSGTVSLSNLTGFENYNHLSGTLTLSGSRASGPGWNVTSGASVTLSGTLNVTSGSGTAFSINGNTSGTVFQILASGSITGSAGLFFNGGPSATFNNAGSVSVTNAAVQTNGSTAITNTGTLASSGNVAIFTGVSVASLINSGLVSGGTTSFGISSQFSAMTITNQAGGFITGGTGAILGGTSGFGNVLTISNASGAGISGPTAISITNLAGLALTNSGQIIGSTNAINASGTRAVSITNNAGGVIATGTLASAGATYVAGGTGHAILLGTSGTITNSGLISSAAAAINQTSTTGTLNLVNTGTIQQVNYANVDPADAINAVGVATILNSGTISSANFYGVVMDRGGTLTNAAGGSIMGGNAGGRYGLLLGGNGSGATVNNYGTISGTAGLGILGGGTPNTINLHAGSTTATVLLGNGNDTLALFNGRGTASTATVDATSGITLQNAGTLAGATVVGSIDLGGGTNTLALRGIGDGTAANGAIGVLSASSIAGLSILNKLDSGTWNVTNGSLNYTGGTNVQGGRLVFVNRTIPGGTTTISSGATLEFNLSGGTYFQDGATFNGAGTFTKSGNAVLANRGLISLAAGALIDVQGGILVGSSDGIGTFTGNLAGLNVASGATFVTSESMVFVDRLTGTGTVGTDISGNFTVGVNNGSATFDGTIINQNGTPGGKLVKAGTGTQTLTGANTYTGATTINGGTLAIGGTGTLGSSTITNNATFDIAGHTGGLSVLNLLGGGTTTLGANTLTITNASGTYSGAFTGTGGLTKQGSGTYILTGTGNTYSGTTTVSAGTLQGSTASFSNTSNIVNNATVAFVQAGSGTFTRGISGTGVVTVSSLAAGNTLTFGGALSNTGGLVISNTSSVTLNAGAAGGILENGAGNRTLTIAGGAANNATGNTFGSGLFVQTTSGTTTVNVASGASLSTTAGSGNNRDGITALSVAAITNNGTISSTANAGIALAGGGSINNFGTITGGSGGNGYGIAVSNGSAATITLQSTSVVTGTQGGVSFQSTGTGANSAQLSNAGQISSTRLGIESGGPGTPVITNLAGGQIVGGQGGIVGGALTISNSGTIGTGTLSAGVFTPGGTGYAITASGASITNLSGGTISGATGSIQLIGTGNVVNLNAGSTTIGDIVATSTTGTNSYTVGGALTGSLTAGSGADTVTLVTSGSFTGQLNGGTGTDAFILDGTSTSSLDVGGITGFESLTKNGTGSFTLSGAANGSTGWTINDGTLNADGGDALADLGRVTVNAAGTLGILSSETIGSLAGNGAVSLGGTLTLGGDDSSSTFAGVASGNGGITKVGTGIFTLSGSNSFLGDVLVSGGTLAYGANDVLADTVTVTVDSGATFNLASFSDTIGTLNLFGTLANGGLLTAGTYNAYAGSTIGQAISSGTLNVFGDTMLNAATAATPVNINMGTLTTGAAELLADTGSVLIASGGQLTLGGAETIGSLGDISGMGGIVELAGFGLTVGGNDASTTFSGTIQSNVAGGGLVKNGTGTFTLAGTNTGLDTIVINAGALSVASADNLGTTGSIGLLGGTLATTGDVTTDRTIFTSSITPVGGIDVATGTTFSVNGTLSGDGALVKTGLGTLNLLADNSALSGDLFVNGGAVRAGDTQAFGTGTIHLVDPTLIYGVTGTYANNILLEVQTPATADPSTLRAESGVFATISGSITQGTGMGVDPNQPLVIDGLGVINLTNTANSWAGRTTITAGSTLHGTTQTISGSELLVNGALRYIQPNSGTLSLNASGTGSIEVSGLGAGQTFTVASMLNMTSFGLTVFDASAIAVTGAIRSTTTTALILNNTGATGTSVLTNSGTISGVAGVFAGRQAAVTNLNGGVISGTTSNAIRLVGANSSLINAGSISGTSTFSGVFFDGVGSVTNQAGGSITNTANAVQFGGASGTLDNSGTISNTNTNSAVFFNGTGTVTNRASGTIGSVNGVGVQLLGAGATVNNFGTITTAQIGVLINGANATVTNAGSISGSNAIQLVTGGTLTNTGMLTSTGGSAVFVQASGTIDNQASGIIQGATNGVSFSAGTATVSNAGSITGGNGAGLRLSGGGTVTNAATGQITGTGNAAILVLSGALNLVNQGSLTGTTGIAIATTGAFDNVIDLQAGSITNGSITTDTGADTLTLNLGATVNGAINGGAGTDGFIVNGAGSSTLAGNITNVESLAMNGSGVLTLGGANAGFTTVAVNSGTLNVTGGAAIDDIAAVSVASGATLGVLTDETVGTLALAGTLAGTGTLTATSYTLDGATVDANLGAGVLTQVSGTSVLNGTAAATSVAINGGTLTLGASDRLANAATVSVVSGATLNLGAFNDTVATLALAGTLAGTGTLTASQYQLTGATVNGNLGAGTLFQLGGTSVLNGTAAATNVMVQGGTLTLGASNRLADAANVAVSTGATLNLGGNLDTVGILQLGGTLGGTGTLTAAQYQLTAATVNGNLGAGTLVQLGGTSVLNGTAGASTVMANAGTLTLGANERLADTAAVQVASGATFNLAGRTETIGSFGGTGTVALGAGRLVAGGNNADFGFGGNITGSGDLDKLGTGTFTLASNLAQTGRLNLNAGTTLFTGSTAGSVRVQGGTLTGSAAIAGNLTVASGTFSPGTTAQPIAVFTAGSFNASGGTLTFDLGGPATGFAADMINVSGATVLSGGTVFTRPLEATANYRVSQNYVLLRSGSLTGTFANGASFAPTGTNPDLQWRLRYDLLPNAVVLELRKQIDFTTDLGPSASGNELAVGAALNGGAFMASDNWASILNTISSQDPATRRATFNSISGEAISDISSATMIATSGFTDLLRQRLALGGGTSGNANLLSGLVGGKQALVALAALTPLDGAALPTDGTYAASTNDDEKRGGVWLQGYGANGRIDGLTGQAGVDTFSAGVAGGIDARFGHVTVGGAFAVSQVETKVRARTSTNEGTLYQGGGYVAYDNGRLYGSVIGSYFSGDINARRSVFVGGALFGVANGTAATRGYTGGAALGYRVPLSQSLLFTPQVSFTATGVTRDAFTETGAGGLSLQAARERREIYAATAEGRLSRPFDALGGTVEPYIGGGAIYSFGDLDTVSTNRFSGAPIGTGTFSIQGARLSPVTALVNGGINVRPSQNVRLGLQGEARLSQRQREERISLNLRIGF